jgi:hypothetical protein
METDIEYFNKRREKAREIFLAQKTLYSPYFEENIVLNSDGFHHLQFSARRERNKREQLLKLNLLPLGLEIIRKSGTIQEYRKQLMLIGKKSLRDGLAPTKEVEYWGLIAIVGGKRIKVRTVLRRIGDGNITFWSVMLYSKIKNGQQRLFTEGIEDE